VVTAKTKALNTEDTEGAEVNSKTKSQKMDGWIEWIGAIDANLLISRFG